MPILPKEYYTDDIIVSLMVRGLYVGADASTFAVTRWEPFPKVFHVRKYKMGTVYSIHCPYRIEFDSGYRSYSFLLDVELEKTDAETEDSRATCKP